MSAALHEPPVDLGLAREHGLTDAEWERILAILGRTPTFSELGIFSVMWSEHCSYKSSRAHLKTLPTQAEHVLVGPGEGAGAVAIGDGLAVIFKIESHNHPSFIEPTQGAATGVGGILRDIFSMGARPIASLDSLRFGPLDDPKHRMLLRGVVHGIGGYGNSVGVATVGGETGFHECYRGNILVNAFNVGLVEADKIFLGQASGLGNPVIYAGSKTGRDGIHGASLLASAEFDEASDAKRPTVQVGDPFTEKCLIEACLEAMRTGVVVGIQDMGAAGLTCSSFEMASRAGTGIEMDLDRVPQRAANLSPYELLLSESQERMLFVTRAGEERAVLDIFARWDLDAVVVGRVTGDGRMRVRWHGETVVDIPVDPVAANAPLYDRPRRAPADLGERQKLDLASIEPETDPAGALLALLDAPNLASKAWIWRQYDSLVQGNTIVGPGGDAALVRVKREDGTPTRKALAISLDCNPRWCWLDPYAGTVAAVAEAARNVACTGARPLALTNCLNFGNPEKPEIMWEFAEAVRGLGDAARALGTPVISGNVSLYNETRGRAIFPTPTIGMVGLLDDFERHAVSHWTAAGQAIVLLGETRDELGGSEWLAVRRGLEAGLPPGVDLAHERRLHTLLAETIASGLVATAHDVGSGGLAVALAECGITGPAALRIGCRVELPAGRAEVQLFGESTGRVLVATADPEALLARARSVDVPAARIGTTGGDRLVIDRLIDLDLATLAATFERAIPRRLEEGVSDSPLEQWIGRDAAQRFAAARERDRYHDACGVFGVHGHPEAAHLTYLGLYALQHRGQESAGIATSNGKEHFVHRAMGLVGDVFHEKILRQLPGRHAVGHVRYSTTGESSLRNAQPFCATTDGGPLALAHNGNLINAGAIRRELEGRGSILTSTSDSEVIIHLLARSREAHPEDRLIDALSRVKGAYSMVMLTDDALVAARDPFGFRPLSLARLGGAWIVASETCAFDLIGAEFERDLEPGEVAVIRRGRLRTLRPFARAPRESFCIFEQIYFARPDSNVIGHSVYQFRKELGRILAREHAVQADMVVPVLDSGNAAALGYAEESGIPYETALIRNQYVKRTFIEPSASIRDFRVRIKHNAPTNLVGGKKVVLVEDSIVRGTTLLKLVGLIRQAGASEVHVRVSSPPNIGPCHYGIDTPTREELIAHRHSVEEIRQILGADTLGYLSLDGLRGAAKHLKHGICDACFSDDYPIPVDAEAEPPQLSLFRPIEAEDDPNVGS